MNQVKPKLRACFLVSLNNIGKLAYCFTVPLNLDIAETVAAATTRACAKKKAMSQPTTGRTRTVTKASGGQKGISTGKCFLRHACVDGV